MVLNLSDPWEDPIKVHPARGFLLKYPLGSTGVWAKAQRTICLRLLGPKTILHKDEVFGLVRASFTRCV